jgi:DNA invertase Pin-like site-specific DNA recombinase
MKQALAYLRVSTDRQAERDLSLPAQLAAIRTFARQEGIEIIRVFEDAGESARTANRPAFREAIDFALSTPGLSAFIVYDTSRFARNREDAVVYKAMLLRKGIRVLYSSQRIDSTDEAGFVLEAVLEIFDEHYSRALSRVVLRGQLENARRGFANGGVAPFGYQFVPATDETGNRKLALAVAPTEAAVVERIFALHREGSGAKAIASQLAQAGLRNRRGGHFCSNGILSILRNPRYVGAAVFNRRAGRVGAIRPGKEKPRSEWIMVEGSNPPIIERSTWNAVQETLAGRRVAEGTARPGAGLLMGLLRCGRCGRLMSREVARGRGGRYAYYVCRTYRKVGKAACIGYRIPAGAFEARVGAHVLDQLLSGRNLRRIVAAGNRAAILRANRGSGRAVELEARVRDLEARVARQHEAIETGSGDLGPLVERVQALSGLLADTQAALVEERRPRAVLAIDGRALATFRASLRRMLLDVENRAAAKRLLARVVREIVFGGDGLRIVYQAEGKPPGALKVGSPGGPGWRGGLIPGRTGLFQGVYASEFRGVDYLIRYGAPAEVLTG